LKLTKQPQMVETFTGRLGYPASALAGMVPAPPEARERDTGQKTETTTPWWTSRSPTWAWCPTSRRRSLPPRA